MAILMAMGSTYGKMGLYIKVISSKDYEKGQACGLIKKEISIKDPSKETRKTEKELLIGQMEIFIKANLLMIWEKDKVKWAGVMEAITKAIGRKELLMVWVIYIWFRNL